MRNRIGIAVMAIGLAASVLSSCSGDEQSPMEPAPVVPDSVSFSRDVQKIFNARCAVTGCHIGPNPTAGLDLTAGSCYLNLVNVPTQVFTPGIRVVPGDLNNSVLYLLVKTGQMPARGEPITPTQLAIIRKWIEDGAPDN